jgi:D-glycero-D-manno-heptose 1,7-bisphosphate phosphatase
MKQTLNKVVFLDRDGVINHDSVDYIKRRQEFEFIPGSLAAIRKLHQNGFALIVITNQSAINRRILTYETLVDIHAFMLSRIQANGGSITDIFFCPHTPEDHCMCRKPKAGMILSAQQKYNLDLSATTMVGDNAKDIQCARNAGCGNALLVKTGNGHKAERELALDQNPPDLVAADLLEAAEAIIANA